MKLTEDHKPIAKIPRRRRPILLLVPALLVILIASTGFGRFFAPEEAGQGRAAVSEAEEAAGQSGRGALPPASGSCFGASRAPAEGAAPAADDKLSVENCPEATGRQAPPYGLEGQIVGGEKAAPGAWPWIVALKMYLGPGYFSFCGGSLVAPQWVLTAAHCVINTRPDQIVATVGPHRLDSGMGRQFAVDRIVIHPRYGFEFAHDFAHDLALLHLTEPAETETAAPLSFAASRCMAAGEEQNPSSHCGLAAPGVTATVIGWGALTEDARAGPLSYDLQQVELPIVSEGECTASMGRIISENMLCAGFSQGGKDACHGDSGSPLVVEDGEGGWRIAGIVSFGIGCARPFFYGVYTRLSSYHAWIQAHVNESPAPSPAPPPGQPPGGQEPTVLFLPAIHQSRVVVRLPGIHGGEPEEPAPAPTAAPRPTATPVPKPPPLPDRLARSAKVPILMYHYVSVPPRDADIYRRDLSVAPDLLRSHLRALVEAGYTAISLYDLAAHLLEGTPLPPKPVILTFDDGYRDNYDNAFPLLKEFGMTAMFFVVTEFMDAGNPTYLSWEMAREMQAAGMFIESHGRDHASLRNRSDEFLVWQALGSAETIEFELGVRPRFITYPFGHFDANTIRIFKSADYWGGVTVNAGATHTTDALFRLKRVRMRGSTSAARLLQLLSLDW